MRDALPNNPAGALQHLRVLVLLHVVQLQFPVADAYLRTLLRTFLHEFLVGHHASVQAAGPVYVRVLGHHEVDDVERVALHAQRQLLVERLGLDAHDDVVADLHLVLQLLPLGRVLELLVAALLGHEGVLEDGLLRGHRHLLGVGRAALEELHGVLELHGVGLLAASADVPCLAEAGTDRVADEHLAQGQAREDGRGQRGLLEDVERVLVALEVALLGLYADVDRVVDGRRVVEAEEHDGRAAAVLDERVVELVEVAVGEGVAGLHLQGVDGGLAVGPFLLLHLRDVGRGDGQGGCGQLQVLVFGGVGLDGHVGHLAVEADDAHVVLEGILRGVALQRRHGPGDCGRMDVEVGHAELAQRVVRVDADHGLGRDERGGLGEVAHLEGAGAVAGLVELHGLRQLGVPLVALHRHRELSLGQQSGAVELVPESVAHVDVVLVEIGEELLHLDAVEQL